MKDRTPAAVAHELVNALRPQHEWKPAPTPGEVERAVAALIRRERATAARRVRYYCSTGSKGCVCRVCVGAAAITNQNRSPLPRLGE